MIFVEPSKGRVRSFWMIGKNNSNNPFNLVQYVHCIRVYESVCKSFITAQVILYDNNNIIENLGIQPGDDAGFGFEAPPNSNIGGKGSSIYGTYADGGQMGVMQVLKMKGEQVPDTLKYQIYYVDLIGPVFYRDKSQQISRTYPGINGTDIINQIWNEKLKTNPYDNLNILTPSDGTLGKDFAPYVRAGESPLTAIKAVMNEMVSSGSSDTGSWLIWKNRDGVNLQQLQQMIAPISGKGSPQLEDIRASTGMSNHGMQEYFLQKETWGAMPTGASWGGAYNDPNIYHGIIVAQVEAREGSGSGGRSSGLNLAGAGNTRQFVHDLGTGNLITQPLVSLGALTGSALGGIIGNIQAGGIAGDQVTSSMIFNNSTAPFTKTAGERSFSGQVKDSPQLVLRVPLQTGLNVTVGGGIWAQLTPPSGTAAGNAGDYLLAGPWLVTDLVHEIYTDQRDSQATTSMQCLKGPR